MSMTERTQVLLTVDQRRRLERIALRQGMSVGAVIRQAIERYAPETDGDEETLEAVFALALPVGNWADMKAEIVEAAAR